MQEQSLPRLSNARSRFSDFSADRPRTVLFISGDDTAAKKPIADLIEQIGLACIDIGALATGGRLQQLGGPLGGARMTLSERFAL